VEIHRQRSPIENWGASIASDKPSGSRTSVRPAKESNMAAQSTNESKIKQRFGKAVRRRRRELDLSQEALAERADVHRTYIANIERGELNPSLENVEKIAKALEMTIADFLAQYQVEDDEQSE
jgi:ribosome-binding protein aMBF1 (putative translation factor)